MSHDLFDNNEMKICWLVHELTNNIDNMRYIWPGNGEIDKAAN